MPLQTQTSAEFYTKIIKLVEDTKLKAQIREEAEKLNYLPKTAKLPL